MKVKIDKLSSIEDKIEQQVEDCLKSKQPKKELVKLFKVMGENNWKQVCEYRFKTRNLTIRQVLKFMSPYLNVENEDKEIEELYNKFLSEHPS